MSVTSSLLREPLLYFLGLGALIFVANEWLDEPPPERVVIEQQELDHLKHLWTLQWRREPGPSELQAIVERHVRQELFYREALRMNLDHGDEIIKRRLAQKMEAVAADLSELMKPPTDAELRTFFRDHAETFRLPHAFAFEQVLFGRDEQAHLKNHLDALRSGAEIPPERAFKMSLPSTWSLTPSEKIEAAFGEKFVAGLGQLPLQQWAGPIESGFGVHLVRVTESKPPHLPEFEEVSDHVTREYEYQSVLRTQEDLYRQLLERYEIHIEADVPAELRAALSQK